ncbi:cation diffusion facilitator family transporter [Sphingomicrobium astaxanthinifaciens]|uniref:cation diffusion facilitator family transporter n=1 Tax=Sphingomicrobium astaxanthinifaciens TaxID=1227949 RepID=UPI001FCB928D|nr:cation diffusion facilitator family transporter [Sphingomicrobium astaxanthinifaciens]MCJ7420829.1 cation diffusion facilitator family transporter [Sphingomicrobium astaxanthinifaciens]
MSGVHGHGHDHGHDHHGARASLTSRAAILSVSVALFLVALKVWASWSTDSVAMLGSLADTALDLIASLVTFFGVRYAAMPADEEHRFGHGKAEAIAALFQVILISVSAIGIAWRAIARFGSGARTQELELGVGVSAVAILVTLGLLAYQRHVIRQTRSVAIQTDHVHYQSDLLLNLAVIAALALDQLGGVPLADPVFGILIALWLLRGAWRGASHAIDQLMDREWDDEKRDRFIAMINAHPELHGIHELRTRTSGGHDFAQFHIWLDPAMTVAEAHDVMDDIEARIHAEFPGVDLLIHPDPKGLEEPGQDMRPETPGHETEPSP